MKIQVTDRDIAKGKRGDCQACALALALRRQWKPRAEVAMDFADSGGSYGDPDYVGAILPDEAVRFIIDFDYGRPVIPFTFELEVA